MFEFSLKAKCSKTKARTGSFSLPNGKIQTPIFMPCGTKGMVKTMLPEELDKLGVQLMLGNTYHLYLRPGEDLIAEKGGLPKWNNWNKPMLTDSGGFQVFSLQGSRSGGESLVKITEEGVEFKSYLDGSKHFFTPEKAIGIQHKLGADIIMAFDECAAAGVEKEYARQAMQRTHNWFDRCYAEHKKLEAQKTEQYEQALFPIVQGGMFDDLRKESANYLNNYDTHGIAIGGLSVGESKETMQAVLDVVVPELDESKPRYLMGVGSPDDLIEGVARGVDMFDCVLATRIARHGCFWTKEGRQNLRLAKYKNDSSPLSSDSDCPYSAGFSRSFIRHMLTEKEITGIRLLTMHNLRFLTKLMAEIREAIANDTFEQLRKEFWLTWETGN